MLSFGCEGSPVFCGGNCFIGSFFTTVVVFNVEFVNFVVDLVASFVETIDLVDWVLSSYDQLTLI